MGKEQELIINIVVFPCINEVIFDKSISQVLPGSEFRVVSIIRLQF